MKLKEYLDTKTLFASIIALENFSFITDEAIYDQLLSIEYGQRTMFDAYSDVSEQDLAKIIVARFKTSWDSYFKATLISEDIASDRTVTETISGNTDTTENGTTTNKVSGFNATSLIDDNGSERDNTQGVVNSQTRELVETESDLSGNYKLLSDISKEQLQTKILHDVASTITLDVY